MIKKEDLMSEKGISLVEVLVSVVIITILFSIISTYFVNSLKQSKSVENKFSAVQLADSLLDSYRSMNFTELYSKVGTKETVDIKSQLSLSPTVNINSFSASAEFSKHQNITLSDNVVNIKISVVTIENGVKRETILEGYKSK